MNIDIDFHLAAVTRMVAASEGDGAPLRAVALARGFDVPLGELWDALTNSERLPRWFLPVTGELRLGGRYQLEGNAGGVIERCEAPALLAVTWEFGGELSWLELRLAAETDDRAQLTLTHLVPVNEHWKIYGAGATGVGWELALLGLAHHLADDGSEPLDGEAFSASPMGKTFITRSCEAWAAAETAAGEDAEQAGAAASKTAAFYTGA